MKSSSTALLGKYFLLVRIGICCMALVGASCFSGGPPEVGDKAPKFRLPALAGGSFRFPVTGRVHVIYFWADWCPRCEDDFKLMERLYHKWQNEPHGPLLVAVDVGQSSEHVRNFIRRLKTSFPIYMDKDGKVARSFGVKGLPTYVITDGKAVVRYVILGWADGKTLLDEVKRIE